MQSENLKVQLLNKNAKLPTRGSKYSAGYDLYSSEEVNIPPRNRILVPTGISISMPKINGFETVGFIKSRSGLSLKKGIEHGAGVIDYDYTGPIGVVLHNHTDNHIYLEKNSRIAQLVILPVITPDILEVKYIEETKRGDSGFGSTGTK